MSNQTETMNIVIVGHVDHGKSTVIGRLLADTKSLPEGKLEQVKALCQLNAKPFEYAFLLDALKDEQAQGITIDSARVFFKTDKRHYIVIDAPGHIEFLKNMISGAARAEAALLVIDAKEGVQENSRRHGYMLSLLGIKQVVVLVNKMDLVDYNQTRYEDIVKEYTQFLSDIKVTPKGFIPISAFEGENLVTPSKEMPWYTGHSVLDFIDRFEKEPPKVSKAFRLPVQDIYKFTEAGDDRRIIAGTIETGSVSVGDKVTFYPSQKSTTVKSVEQFNAPVANSAKAGQAVGLTLETQLYVKPGEIMVKDGDVQPETGTAFKANIVWLGKRPLIKEKRYKLKLATSRMPVYVKDIVNVMDASNLSGDGNNVNVKRHEVAEVIFQTLKPMAYDLTANFESTGRFVIVDDFDIAGGGIITEPVLEESSRLSDHIKKREFGWERSRLSAVDRAKRLGQKPRLILISGPEESGKIDLAKALEEALFKAGKNVYYLGISNVVNSLSGESGARVETREDHLAWLGEMAHMFCDAGFILISTISDLDDDEAELIKTISGLDDVMLIGVGDQPFNRFPVEVRLPIGNPLNQSVNTIKETLYKNDTLLEFNI